MNFNIGYYPDTWKNSTEHWFVVWVTYSQWVDVAVSEICVDSMSVVPLVVNIDSHWVQDLRDDCFLQGAQGKEGQVRTTIYQLVEDNENETH